MDSFWESDLTQNTEEDDTGFYLYGGTGCQPDDDLTHMEPSARKTKMRQVADTVRGLYESGVPLFTRSAIQALVHQIDRVTERFQNEVLSGNYGQKFSLQALDGKTVEIDIEVGSTQPYSSTRELVV